MSVNFNSLIPDEPEHCLPFDRRATLLELKAAMSAKLGVPVNQFKVSPNAVHGVAALV